MPLATFPVSLSTLRIKCCRFLKAVDPEVSGKTAAGAEAYRQAAEAALTAVGMHLTEGHHIWQLYR
jgi:hypothetical protein